MGQSVSFRNGTAHEADEWGVRLDLDTAPLIVERISHITDRIRQDLKRISEYVCRNVPNASVLLTGSLSVGEGRCEKDLEPRILESDYDLVIVTPSFVNTIPTVAEKNLKPLFSKHGFSSPIEITLIWKPLLALKITTTAGKVLAGDHRVAGMLEKLPPPRAVGALQNAYCQLSAVPTAPSRYNTLLSKAFFKAAQAVFLERLSAAPRREWAGFTSIRFIQEKLEEYRRYFDPDEIECMLSAGDHLLRKKWVAWDREHFFIAKNLLDRIRLHIVHPAGRLELIKRAGWALQDRRVYMGSLSKRIDSLRALQLLVEAWGVAEAPKGRPLAAAARQIGKLCSDIFPEDRCEMQALYGKLFRILNRYVSYYPNKLYYPGGGGRHFS